MKYRVILHSEKERDLFEILFDNRVDDKSLIPIFEQILLKKPFTKEAFLSLYEDKTFELPKTFFEKANDLFDYA